MTLRICPVGVMVLSFAAAGVSNAGQEIILGPVRTSVESADVIVHGTLTNVKRRDAFVRMRNPEFGFLSEQHYDTGEIAVDNVIWGEIRANPVPICFETKRRSSSDPRTRLGEFPSTRTYASGDRGLWMLQRMPIQFWYYVLVVDSYNMIPESDPRYEGVLQLIAERRDREGKAP